MQVRSSRSSSCESVFDENLQQKEKENGTENKIESFCQNIFNEIINKSSLSTTHLTIRFKEPKDLTSLEQKAIDYLDRLKDFDVFNESEKNEAENLILKLTGNDSYVLATDLMRAITEQNLIPTEESEKWFFSLVKSIIKKIRYEPENTVTYEPENYLISLDEQVTENLFETALNIKSELRDSKKCPQFLKEAIDLILKLDTVPGLSDIKKELSYFISLESTRADDIKYFSELLKEKQIKQATEILAPRISKKFYPIQDTLFFYYRLMQSIKSYQKDEIDSDTLNRLTECALQLKSLILKNQIEEADNNVDYLKGGIRILLTFLDDTLESSNELSKYVSLVDLPKFNAIKVYSKNIKLSSFQDWCEFWSSSEKLDKNKKQQWERFVNENNVWSKWLAFALDKQKIKNQRFDLLFQNWKIALNHSNSFKNCNTLELFQSKKMEEFLLQCIPYPKELEGLYLQLFKGSVNKLKLQSQDKNQALSSKTPDAAVNLLLKHTLLFEKCKLYPIASNLDIIEADNLDIIEADLIYLLKNKFHFKTAIPFCQIFINHLTQKICHDFCEEYFWKFFTGQFSYKDDEKLALLKAAHAWRVFKSEPVQQQPKFYEYIDSLLTLGKEAYDEALFFAMQYIQSHPSEASQVKKFYELIDKCSVQALNKLKVWLKTNEKNMGVNDFIKNCWWKITERELEKGITPHNIEIFEERACYFMENKKTYEKMHELAREHWKNLIASNISIKEFGESAMTLYKWHKPTCSRKFFPSFDLDDFELYEAKEKVIEFISRLELLIKSNPDINIPTHSKMSSIATGSLALFLFHVASQSIYDIKKMSKNEKAPLYSELTSIIHLLTCQSSYKALLYKAHLEAIFNINSQKNDPSHCLKVFHNPLFWRLYYLAQHDFDKSLPKKIIKELASNKYDKIKGLILLELAREGIEKINSPERLKLVIKSFNYVGEVFNASRLQNLLIGVEAFNTIEFNDKYEKIWLASKLLDSIVGKHTYKNLTENREEDDFKNIFSTLDNTTKNLTSQIIEKLFAIIIEESQFAFQNNYLTAKWLSLILKAFKYLFCFKGLGFCDEDLFVQTTLTMQNLCIKFLGESPDLKNMDKIMALELCSKICKLLIKSYISVENHSSLIDENIVTIAVNHMKTLENCYVNNKDFLEEADLPWACLLKYMFICDHKKEDKNFLRLQDAFKSLMANIPNMMKYILLKAHHLSTENVPKLVEQLSTFFNIFKIGLVSNPKALKYCVYLLFKFADEDSQKRNNEATSLKDFIEKHKDKSMLGSKSWENSTLIYNFVSEVFDYVLDNGFPNLYYICEKENNILPIYKLFEKLTFLIHYFHKHNLYGFNNLFYLNSMNKLSSIFSQSRSFIKTREETENFAKRYGSFMDNFFYPNHNFNLYYTQEKFDLLCQILINYIKITVWQLNMGIGTQDSYQQLQDVTIKHFDEFKFYTQASLYSREFKSPLEDLKTLVSDKLKK